MTQIEVLNALFGRGYEGSIDFDEDGKISTIRLWPPGKLEASDDAIPIVELKGRLGQLDTNEAEVVQKIINWWLLVRRFEINDSY